MRPPRFRLRTLLVAVAAVALIFGMIHAGIGEVRRRQALARYEAALTVFQDIQKRIDEGEASIEDFRAVSLDLMDARRAVGDSKEDHVVAATGHRERLRSRIAKSMRVRCILWSEGGLSYAERWNSGALHEADSLVAKAEAE